MLYGKAELAYKGWQVFVKKDKRTIGEMGNPIRVLQGFVEDDGGGLTKYICDTYRHIDKTKVQYDFLCFDDNLSFQKEFETMGARFYKLPRLKHTVQYLKMLRRIAVENNYQIVHFNMSYANILPALALYKSGIEHIIWHSHSTGIDDNRPIIRFLKCLYHVIGKLILEVLATDYWACSILAAKWMFSSSVIQESHYKILKNGIAIDKFKFSLEKRDKLRKELKVTDKDFVIGHVGRFCYPKNQEYLINIFNEIAKKNKNAKLLFIGKLENENGYLGRCKSLVKKFEIEDKVWFLGSRSDVPSLLQVMDCFCLPSQFEGLPIVGIEAQASGLPCCFSNKITNEVKLIDEAMFLPLEEKLAWEKWLLAINEKEKRERMAEVVKKAGYDISECAEMTVLNYLEMIEKR